MKHRKLFISIGAVVFVAVVALATVLLFKHFETNNISKQAPDRVAIKKDAQAKLDAGTADEKSGKTKEALAEYEKAYAQYVKLGDKEAALTLAAKITYLRSLLDKAGTKYTPTVDVDAGEKTVTSGDPTPPATVQSNAPTM